VQAQDPQPQQPENAILVLEKQGNHTVFLRAIRAAGLEETLRGEGTFTVFAPTDEAFAKLPEGKLDELLADQEAVKALVSFHIVPRKIVVVDVTEPMSVPTLGGTNVLISKEGEILKVRAPAAAAEVRGAEPPPGAVVTTVVTPDGQAVNGVIHAVDTVLLVEGG
jgi:uncharacterized surface protein with fasciclin (FAS1) repeats